MNLVCFSKNNRKWPKAKGAVSFAKLHTLISFNKKNRSFKKDVEQNWPQN